MVLIFGGAYQGKLDYALEKYNLNENDVYRCKADNIDMPQNKIIYEIDKWVLALIKTGCNGELLREKLIHFVGAVCDRPRANTVRPYEIIICNDISCGIVPVDPDLRMWRETVGRLLADLSKISDGVVRLFCGIPTIIK